MINQIHFGDCRDSLRAMAAAGVKVQTCVTSPPYFGLRDYGHEGQIGLEETPEQFIAELVEVFRCVRDVLSDDGTLWVNIGDSYARNPSKGGSGPGGKNGAYSDTYTGAQASKVANARVRGDAAQSGAASEVKEKDLIGIPWMLAFALRADGWYLRQDIIWHKPNPMPESVTDRCTKAHEYLFLLSKSPRYFYDHEAVKEPVAGDPDAPRNRWDTKDYYVPGQKPQKRVSRRPSVKRGGFNGKTEAMAATGQNAFRAVVDKRNRRSVWAIATRPYAGAHFAVFPPALVEPCILAGTSQQGHCPECGARWVRQVDRTPMVIDKSSRNQERGTRTGCSGQMLEPASSVTTGWAPSCDCGCDPVPDVVLDPFMGSGTTAAVAIENGLHFTGCELNQEYKPLQDQRIAEARALVVEREAEQAMADAQLDMFASQDYRHFRALSGAENETIIEKANV